MSEIKNLLNRIPTEDDTYTSSSRNQLFNRWDRLGNGYLSVTDFEAGLKGEFRADDISDNNNLINFTFKVVRDCYIPPKYLPTDDKYIEKGDFRTYLVYIKLFYEIYSLYKVINRTFDFQITLKQFIDIIPLFAKYGHEISNPVEAFKKMDTGYNFQVGYKELINYYVSAIGYPQLSNSVKLKTEEFLSKPKKEVLGKNLQFKEIENYYKEMYWRTKHLLKQKILHNSEDMTILDSVKNVFISTFLEKGGKQRKSNKLYIKEQTESIQSDYFKQLPLFAVKNDRYNICYEYGFYVEIQGYRIHILFWFEAYFLLIFNNNVRIGSKNYLDSINYIMMNSFSFNKISELSDSSSNNMAKYNNFKGWQYKIFRYLKNLNKHVVLGVKQDNQPISYYVERLNNEFMIYYLYNNYVDYIVNNKNEYETVLICGSNLTAMSSYLDHHHMDFQRLKVCVVDYSHMFYYTYENNRLRFAEMKEFNFTDL